MTEMMDKKNKKIKSCYGKSTHCTSLGVAAHFDLEKHYIPSSLRYVLKYGLDETLAKTQLAKNYIQCIRSFSNMQRIEAKHYLLLFKIFLFMEEYEMQKCAAKNNLKNVEIMILTNTFAIMVPTLDEDEPLLTPGDTVIIKPYESQKKFFGNISEIVGKKVTVRLHQNMHTYSEKVDIIFCIQNWPINCAHYALQNLLRYNIIHIIYPSIKATTNLSIQDSEENLEWFHETIGENMEQKQAVINILNKSAYPLPYIIFGPPGTGKTTTLVEAICQIRKLYPSKNILVCTSSNAAADEVAKRLLALYPTRDVFRMYSVSKNCGNICETIKPYSNYVENKAIFLRKNMLMKKKIVISTLVTSTKLLPLNLQCEHFSYIFIDEAGQSTEPEALIPFALTSKKAGSRGTVCAQIVFAGDPFQLGPIVQCKRIEHLYGISILERIMTCDPYKKINNKYNSRYITKLIRNYRSLEPIIHVPNKLFYENDLLSFKESEQKLVLNWPEIKNKNFPIIFFETSGKEIRTQSRSVYNVEEIALVMHYVQKLLDLKIGHRRITQDDIGIVTPFKRQHVMLRNQLQKSKLDNVTVGTVEVFQGQEKSIMILSTVRSCTFEHDGKTHIGFLSQKKRFNVAITRAKEILIIFGNPSVLCTSEVWKELWTYCKKNNACASINSELITSIKTKSIITKINDNKFKLKKIGNENRAQNNQI